MPATQPSLQPAPSNLLFFGDNLPVLRGRVEKESVDLIYLDPPFNSNANYNVLFKEHDGTQAAAQIRAFEDTWTWDEAAVAAYQECVSLGGRVSDAVQGFYKLLGGSNMMAYLAMMAQRVVELRRVLKPTGSIYLHCDDTACHYLKLLMDAVFGPRNYRNQIVWRRTEAHNDARRFGRVTDCLLFYTKTNDFTWNRPAGVRSQKQLGRYQEDEAGRLYRCENLTAPGTRNGETGESWRGRDPTSKGNHWKFPPSKLERMFEEGKILCTKDGRPRLDGWKVYLEETPPPLLQNWWGDIPRVPNTSAERLGYPTQKPEALLERIIRASSNEGDVVLDPFCGCGTAVAVAQRLNRHWIGIDITHLAITLIKRRMEDAFGAQVRKTYKVEGVPASLYDAATLAKQDRYQFQWWALDLVGACPVAEERKKGADKAVDGRLYFYDEPDPNKVKQIIFSVKSGAVGVEMIRELGFAMSEHKAAVGVFVTLEEPTKPMRTTAAGLGYYVSPFGGTKVRRLQILTIEQLLNGEMVDIPPNKRLVAFKPATPKKGKKAKAVGLFGEEIQP